MNYKKSVVLCLSALAVASGIFAVNSSIIAHADDYSELEDNFNDMKNESETLFEDLKDKYVDLADNYGKIEIVDKDEVYLKYLNDLEKSKTELNIDKKLEDIRNTDLSVDNSEMREEYERAKKDAARTLANAKLSSDAIVSKFNGIKQEQTQKQKEVEKERVKAAQTKYNNIVNGYYEVLNKKATVTHGIPSGVGQFKVNDLEYLAYSIGINFNKVVVQGKMGVLENLNYQVVNTANKTINTTNAYNNNPLSVSEYRGTSSIIGSTVGNGRK